MRTLPRIPAPDRVLIGLLVLSIAFAAARRLGAGSAAFPAFVYPEPGEGLPNIVLTQGDRPSEGRRLHSLLAEAGDSCTALIFFSAKCGYCRQLAPFWSNVDAISGPGFDVPVVWVAVDAEEMDGNQEFISTHELPRQWYAVRTIQDLASIGVDRWPIVYVAGAAGLFRGLTESRDPTTVREELGALCAGGPLDEE